MGYDIIPVYEGLPDVIDDVNTSLVTMNSTMLNGMMDASFGGIHNTYQDIIDDQDDFKKKTDEGVEAIGKVYKGIKNVAKAFIETKALAKGFSSAVNYSENLMSMQDSISDINDGGQSDTELRDKIYGASMRSRIDMGSTINTVEGLSSAGFSNDEAIQYTENLNKMFATAGVSDEAQAGATSALVESLSDGVVSGEELNSILNTTPEIVAGMAENIGMSIEQMISMAEQGQLSADIMKNSMLGATDSINAEFSNTRANWSDIMTNVGNMATVAFEPVGNKINEIINSPSFGTFMSNLGESMSFFANVLGSVIDIVGSVGGFVADNWSWIQPILITIIGLLGYIMIATLGVTKVQEIAKTATDAWNKASSVLNAVWATCPIVLIILAIIAVFYVIIGLINHLTGSSISATGLITGAIMTAVAVIWNAFLALADIILGIIGALINPFISIANFIGNVFTNPISSIIYLFRDMAVNVLSVIKTIASAIDKVFGTNMAGTVDGWIDGVNTLADKAVEKFAPDENYEVKYEKFDLSTESLGFERMDYGDSFDTGYEFGEGLTDFSMPDIGSGLGDFGMSTGDVDYSNMFEGTGLTENTVNGINRSAEETGTNTYDINNNTMETGVNTENIAANTQNLGTNAESISGYTMSLESSNNELVNIGRSILGIMQENMEKEKSNNNSSVVIDMRYMSNNVKSQADADNLIERLKSEISAGLNGKTEGAGGSVFAGAVG